MKKYYQYFGLALIMVFSFYYTDKISTIVLNKNPLMMTIQEKAIDYNVKSVNAEINGNNITPGINGLKVNLKESFYGMQADDIFNQYYLVFDQEKPKISLENNKDKIITKGNRKLKQVSFIFEEENALSDYFKSNSLNASLLVTLNSYKEENYFEVINNETDGFKSLENALNLSKNNKHICVLNDYNLSICLKQKNYLVDSPLKLSNTNFLEVKNGLQNGSIIYVTRNANLTDLKLLVKEIKYKDLEIVPLSKIISEINYQNE